MTQIWSQAGMTALGKLITNNTVTEDLTLRLFQNDLTPTHANVLIDFTEATFTGYAAAPLTAANWTSTPASTVVFEYAPAVAFTSSADLQNQNIYGYYITRNTTGDVIASERFSDGPYNIANNLDKISVTPKFTITNAGA